MQNSNKLSIKPWSETYFIGLMKHASKNVKPNRLGVFQCDYIWDSFKFGRDLFLNKQLG